MNAGIYKKYYKLDDPKVIIYAKETGFSVMSLKTKYHNSDKTEMDKLAFLRMYRREGC